MLRLLLVVLIIAYPALVYFGLAHFRPATFAILIGLFTVLRLGIVQGAERRWVLAIAALLVAYAVLVLAFDSELLVRLYPALVSAFLLASFAWTLVRPPSMIERISRARGMPISPAGIIYTRRLTAVWCTFFLANGALAVYTSLAASRATWALYNGLLVYLLIGLLLVVELPIRRWYQRRHGVHPVGSS